MWSSRKAYKGFWALALFISVCLSLCEYSCVHTRVYELTFSFCNNIFPSVLMKGEYQSGIPFRDAFISWWCFQLTGVRLKAFSHNSCLIYFRNCQIIVDISSTCSCWAMLVFRFPCFKEKQHMNQASTLRKIWMLQNNNEYVELEKKKEKLNAFSKFNKLGLRAAKLTLKLSVRRKRE